MGVGQVADEVGVRRSETEMGTDERCGFNLSGLRPSLILGVRIWELRAEM